MTTAVLMVRLLGDLALTYGTTPVAVVESPRLQSLIAYLVLHAGVPQSRAYLAAQLWPDSEECQALSNLRNLLTRAKQFFPDLERFVRTSRTTLQWASDAPFRCDVHELEACVRQPPDEAVLERAMELYRGDLVPACYDEWIAPERERLRSAFQKFLDLGTQRLDDDRNYTMALRCAHRRLELDPLHEGAYLSLMRLYAATHNRAAALHVYKTCVETLQRELQTRPGRALRELAQQLQSSDAQLPAAAPAPRPFVGRTAEWRQLQSAWSAASGGVTQAVALLGDPGVGKTRLLEELTSWAASLGIQVASARCYGVEGHLAFAPVISLIRSCMPRKLAPVWRSELARLLPELGSPSATTAPEFPVEPWQRQRLFEALARAVLASQPLLVAIDDLHWCDRDSLEWIHFLFRFDPSARLLLVMTVRPEEVEVDHPVMALVETLSRDQRLLRLHLSPLDAATTAQLAAAMSGHELEPAAALRLYEETEGNCLYIVETIREKLLDPAPSGQSSMPTTLEALLGVRFASLSPEARGLAELASVVGRAFSMDELESVSGLDLRAFLQTLDELERRGIIREQGDGRLDFSHSKLRQFAYSRQRSARRRMQHLHVAQALERLPADAHFSLSGEIASHYLKGGMTLNAASHYLRAGEAARRVEAYLEAIELYHSALKCLEREDRLELHRAALSGREHAYEALGDVQAALADLRSLEQLALEHGDNAWLADVRNRQSYLAYTRGQAAVAARLAEEAQRMAREAASPLIEATASFNLSKALSVVDPEGLERILEAQENALILAHRIPAPLLEGDLLAQSAFTYCMMNRPQDARNCLEDALRIAHRLANRRLEAAVLFSLASVDYHTYRYGDAIGSLERATELAHEISVRSDIITYEGILGQCLTRRRHYREALVHFRAALELAGELQITFAQSIWLSYIGYSLHDLGDEPGAFEHFEKSVAIATKAGISRFQQGVLFRYALVSVAFDRPEQGLELVQRAIAIQLPPEQPQTRYEQACLEYALGKAAAGLHRWTEAAETLERALTLCSSSRDLRAELTALSCRTAQAEVDLALDQPQRALQRLEPLIVHLDIDPDRLAYPQRVSLVRSRALEALGEHAAAREELERARRIVLETAQRLRGSPYYTTYLERVVVNRAILEASRLACL